MAKEKKFQSKNDVTIVGVLEKVEIKNTRGDGSPMTTKAGIPMKIAELHIRVAEGERHLIKFLAIKHFKAGETNTTPRWDTVNEIENGGYVTEQESQDSNSPHYGKDADIVRATAHFEKNVYVDRAGKLQERVQLAGNRVWKLNRKDVKPEEVGALFQVDTVILNKPRPEMKGDEETGRLLIDAAIIDYQNKAMPFTFVAGSQEPTQTASEEEKEEITKTNAESVDYLSESLEPGFSMRLSGEYINRYVVVEVKQEGGFGQGAVDTHRDIVNELRTYGGGTPRDPEDYDEAEHSAETLAFPSQFEEAKKNWTQYVEEQKSTSNSKKKETASKSTASSGRTTGFGGQKKTGATAKPATSFNDDDLPF